MIKVFKLPTSAEPFYSFTQTYTSDIEVEFLIRWNGEADCYFIDIRENYADPKKEDYAVLSIPLTEGLNLVENYEFSFEALLCDRVAVDPQIKPTRFDELGDTMQVYIITDYDEV